MSRTHWICKLRCKTFLVSSRSAPSRLRLTVRPPVRFFPFFTTRHVIATYCFGPGSHYVKAGNGPNESVTEYYTIDLKKLKKMRSDLPVKVKYLMGRRYCKGFLDIKLGDLLQELESRPAPVTLQFTDTPAGPRLFWLREERMSDSPVVSVSTVSVPPNTGNAKIVGSALRTSGNQHTVEHEFVDVEGETVRLAAHDDKDQALEILSKCNSHPQSNSHPFCKNSEFLVILGTTTSEKATPSETPRSQDPVTFEIPYLENSTPAETSARPKKRRRGRGLRKPNKSPLSKSQISPEVSAERAAPPETLSSESPVLAETLTRSKKQRRSGRCLRKSHETYHSESPVPLATTSESSAPPEAPFLENFLPPETLPESPILPSTLPSESSVHTAIPSPESSVQN